MLQPGGPYSATVTRITGDGAYVIATQLAGNSELGPCNMLMNFRISTHDSAGLKPGDRVLVTPIDNQKDQIAILGVLLKPTAPIAAPAASPTWPGW
jgi:hypothetical protein